MVRGLLIIEFSRGWGVGGGGGFRFPLPDQRTSRTSKKVPFLDVRYTKYMYQWAKKLILMPQVSSYRYFTSLRSVHSWVWHDYLLIHVCAVYL